MDNNYYDTFIEVAPDCLVPAAQAPDAKAARLSIARLQFQMLADNPYRYTQEDVLFETYADAHDIPTAQRPAARIAFFTRGQACLRASALGKRYGWGTHHNAEGKVALYAVESAEYQRLKNDPALKHLKAMRSKRV